MTDLPLGVEAYPEEAVGRSDAELITAVRSGDNEAYGGLFDRHVGAARSMARQLTRDPNEAEDLVAEAFAKVLVVLQGGGGPDVAFRAYLLTSLRRVAYDRTRSGSRVQVTDDLTPYDPGVEFVDPAIEGLEKSIVSRAYASLPERWQTVLWHTEVEGLQPGEVAPLLGLTANGVAALAYRAREGLRQAYLQQHVMGELDDACRPYADKLGSYARGGLAKRETAHVEQHLEGCERCRALVLELTDVNHGMRVIVAPLVLGLLAAGYLKAAAAGGAAIGLVGSGSGTGAAGGAGGTTAAAGTAGTAGTAGAAGTAGTAAAAGATASAGAGMTAAVTGVAAAAGSASGSGAAGVAAAGGHGASTTVGYVTSTVSSTAGATAGTTAGAGSAAAAGTSAGLTVIPGAAATGGLFAGGGLLAGAAAAVVGLAAAGVVVAVVASTNDQGPVTALPPSTTSSVPVIPGPGGAGSGGGGGSSAPAAPAQPLLPAPAATSESPHPTPTPTSLPTRTPAPTHTLTAPAPTATTPAPTVTSEPTPAPTVTSEPTPIPTFSPMPEPTGQPPTPTPTPTEPGTATPTTTPADTASPTPTDTGTATPSPTDTGTATPSPTDTGTATPSPTDTGNPSPPSDPFAATVPGTFGDLVAGQYGWIGFRLVNNSGSAGPQLSATIVLPQGISLSSGLSGFDSGQSQWTCTRTSTGAVCTNTALPPRVATTLTLRVFAAPDSVGQGPVRITIVGPGIDPIVVPDKRVVLAAEGHGG